jgi:hypothetical protein
VTRGGGAAARPSEGMITPLLTRSATGTRTTRTPSARSAAGRAGS